MEPERFRSSPAGRLIWVGKGETAYWAFVPHPLPPELDWDWELGRILSEFEAIHPFVDGNGRIGRLLITLLLVEWELLPLPLLYLSAYFYRHRQDYYDLLLAVSERGEWRDWMLFFLRGVAEQARDANLRIRRLQDLRTAWRERLTQARASALLLRLVDALFESPVITIPLAQELMGVTYHSARRSVMRLVQEGILQAAGNETYKKTFVASDILEITITAGIETAHDS